MWLTLLCQEKAHHAREGVTAADYSVRVSGLPRDATKEEVLEHFNGLYDLSKYDWHQKGYCFGCCFRKKSRRPPALVNAAARLDKEAAMDKSRAVRATTCPAWHEGYLWSFDAGDRCNSAARQAAPATQSPPRAKRNTLGLWQ